MASSSSSSRNWLELPRDVMATILHKLGPVEILESAQKVCMTWRSICKEPAMWRSIDMRGGDTCSIYHLNMMARHAIDRSSGQLLEIFLDYFASDDLLHYLAQRASQLRRLRLVRCHDISDEGLGEAVKKLPLLEELHIYFSSLSSEALEAVGRCCPHLKSLTFNDRGSKASYMLCDEDALAIAKTMPGLRHLQLFGNKMTNDGLQAILDGCPQLESLDLRQCFKVNLGGPVGKICSERIKDLRRPLDSTDDYEFDATFDEEEDSENDFSFDNEYPNGFSDIDLTDVGEEDYEFSGNSDFTDDEEVFYD